MLLDMAEEPESVVDQAAGFGQLRVNRIWKESVVLRGEMSPSSGIDRVAKCVRQPNVTGGDFGQAEAMSHPQVEATQPPSNARRHITH
jgi:hypothetical protein